MNFIKIFKLFFLVLIVFLAFSSAFYFSFKNIDFAVENFESKFQSNVVKNNVDCSGFVLREKLGRNECVRFEPRAIRGRRTCVAIPVDISNCAKILEKPLNIGGRVPAIPPLLRLLPPFQITSRPCISAPLNVFNWQMHASIISYEPFLAPADDDGIAAGRQLVNGLQFPNGVFVDSTSITFDIQAGTYDFAYRPAFNALDLHLQGLENLPLMTGYSFTSINANVNGVAVQGFETRRLQGSPRFGTIVSEEKIGSYPNGTVYNYFENRPVSGEVVQVLFSMEDTVRLINESTEGSLIVNADNVQGYICEYNTA